MKRLIIGGLIGATAVTVAIGGSLTWLFVLACPLMMVFMHGGHGHGSHHTNASHPDRHGVAGSAPESELTERR